MEKFIGYDLALCESPYVPYSLIFEEIFQGKYPKLAMYSKELNGSFLASDPQLFRRYLETRRAVVEEGADLEDIDCEFCSKPEVVAVFSIES